MLVEECMTPHPVTVNSRSTLREAIKLMAELKLRAIPVVSGSEYLGMLTDSGIRDPLAAALSKEIDRKSQRALLDSPVIRYMREDLPILSPESRIVEAISLVLESESGVVPVLDDRGMLCGVIGSRDLLKVTRAYLDD